MIEDNLDSMIRKILAKRILDDETVSYNSVVNELLGKVLES